MRNASRRSDLTTPPAPAPDGAVPAFANGSLIDGKYLVEETLAEGGIGVVIVARHLALDQRVAIKYLKPEARDNPATLERFVREGRLAAQIASEHVVRVHDVGMVAEGGPYIVMEHLVGEDLGHVVRRGPVPVTLAVDYVLQACEALASAHALRIVHRDIKPENLFLVQRGSNTPIVKVVDFGISKIAPKRDHEGRWAHETSAGERFGTPLYMSPEQLRSSSQVDPRTDVWSLGVTLHELITTTLPFEGNDLPQLCTSVLTGAPTPLTAARPDAPPLLEAVILRCLEKEPDHRFQNLAELAQELAPFGPPDAMARAGRIKDVIRSAGEIVRPSTPSSQSVEIRPSLNVATMPSSARPVTTDAEKATLLNARTDARMARRRTAIAWVASGLCVVVLTALLETARRSRYAATESQAVGSPSSFAMALGASLDPPAAEPGVVPATTTTAIAVPSAAPPSVAVLSAAPGGAHAKPAASSKPLRTVPQQRRSLFGERK